MFLQRFSRIFAVILLVVFSVSLLPAQSAPLSSPVTQEMYDALKKTQATLEANYQTLLSNYEQRETTLQDVLEHSVNLMILLTDTQKRLQLSTDEVATYKNNLTKLMLQLGDSQANLLTIKQELLASQAKLADIKKQLDDLQIALTNSNQKLVDSAANLKRISDLYQQVSTDLDKLTLDYQTLSSKYNILLTQFDEISKKLEQTQSDLKSAQDLAAQLQKDLDKIQADNLNSLLSGLGIGTGVGAVIVIVIWALSSSHK